MRVQSKNPLYRITENGKWGFIDGNGKVVIPVKYDGVGWYYDRFVTVNMGAEMKINKGGAIISSSNGKWGIVARDGRVLHKPQFDDIYYQTDTQLIQLGIHTGTEWERKKCYFQKIGFIDSKTATFIPPRYAYVSSFQNGIATMNEGASCRKDDLYGNKGKLIGGKWGALHVSGKILIKPKYDFAEYVPEANVLRVHEGGVCDEEANCTGGRWGLVDTKGNVLVPSKFEGLYPEKEVVWYRENKKWGLMDYKEKILAGAMFDGYDVFTGDVAFVCSNNPGRCQSRRYYCYEGRCGKWGILHKSGKVIVEPVFSSIGTFSDEGASAFTLEKRGKIGLINKEGEVILKPQYDTLYYDGRECVFKSGIEIKSEKRRQMLYGLVSPSGEVLMEPEYGWIEYHPESGTADVYKNGGCARTIEGLKCGGGKWGIVRYDGKIILEPKYTGKSGSFVMIGGECAAPSAGESMICKNGKWGVVNADGKFILSPKYDSLQTVGSTFIKIYSKADCVKGESCKNEGFGIADMSGNILIEPAYHEIEIDSEVNLIQVKIGKTCPVKEWASNCPENKWGWLDLKGKPILQPVFDNPVYFNGPLGELILEGKLTYVNRSGKIVWQAK